jgi:hypothetical protein
MLGLSVLRATVLLLTVLAPAAALAQAATVAGRVTDAGGRPLAGASVAIEGSGARTATVSRDFRLFPAAAACAALPVR